MLKIEDRKLSFLLILAVYIAAAAVGLLTYRAASHLPLFAALLIADVAATAAVFLFSLLFGNASVYDPYWSVQPPVILCALAFEGRAFSAADILLLTVVFLWAIRLTANWAYTFHGLTHEDWRYRMLRDKTGAFFPAVNFLGIHLFPTLVVYACILPAAYALRDGEGGGILFAVGLVISLLAVTLQFVADTEMQAFRRRGEGCFIRVGIWRNARHPNYLGEILMWWGVALASLSRLPLPYLPLAIGALANNLMFLFISIPMADRRQARKEGYAEYKKETRSLLPIPR